MIKAKIYRPAKNAMQSGRGKMQQWLLEYRSAGKRGPENLMGWTSADDTLGQVRLSFDTMEEARDYAEKEGLAYVITPSNERKVKPRNYGDNFKYDGPREEPPKKPTKKTAKK